MGPNSFLVCTVSVALFVEQSGLGSLWRGGRSLSVPFGGVLRVVVAVECWAVEGSLCGATCFSCITLW